MKPLQLCRSCVEPAIQGHTLCLRCLVEQSKKNAKGVVWPSRK